MPSSSVRIDERALIVLRDLAREERQSLQAVLNLAIENYRRQRLLEQANAAFSALHGDPSAWSEEQREREIWDLSLADGLERE
jgi:uncharacterized protein YigA (DUF484 family)